MHLTVSAFFTKCFESWFFTRVKKSQSPDFNVCLNYINEMIGSECLRIQRWITLNTASSHPAYNAIAASACSLSLSVIRSLSAARDWITSIESLIWISFAKTWPITKRKQENLDVHVNMLLITHTNYIYKAHLHEFWKYSVTWPSVADAE